MTVTVPALRLPTPAEFAAELRAQPYPAAVRKGDLDLGWLPSRVRECGAAGESRRRPGAAA
jgi:hypothetical protein